MANFITLPQVTPTGYGQLGQVILGASQDYAARQRQQQDEERRQQEAMATHQLLRGEHLADVADERTYLDKREEATRKQRLADVEAEKLFAAKTEMMRLGYLKPQDFDNPDALNTALGRLHNDGLLQKYKGALESGDLSYADLADGDASKIDAGLKKYSARAAAETTRKSDAVAGGTAQAADVQRRQRALEESEHQLGQQIATFEVEAARRPSPQEIEIRANEIAAPLAKKTGAPTPAERAAHYGEAEQALKQERQERIYVHIQALKDQLSLNRQQQIANTSQQNMLAGHGMFAPASVFQEPTTTPQATAPVPNGVSLESARAQAQAKYGGGAASTPNPVQARFDIPPGPTPDRSPTQARFDIPAGAGPENPFQGAVTEPKEVRSPAGGIIATPADTQRARNTEYVGDLFRRGVDALSNFMPRGIIPSEIGANGLVSVESSPGMRARAIDQIKSRLAAIQQPGTQLEADLRQELSRLIKMNDQQATEQAQSVVQEPVVNTATSSTPRGPLTRNSSVFPSSMQSSPWWAPAAAPGGF